MRKETINTFISRFRLNDKDGDVFRFGCCYWFSFILHNRFTESRIMYDSVVNHFVTEIDGRLYDCTGDVTGLYDVVAWDSFDDALEKERIIKNCIMFGE